MYLGPLTGETMHYFDDIRSAIWWWEYKRTVVALLMPRKVFCHLEWRAQSEKVTQYEWTKFRNGDVRICTKPVIIDERVTGIEYLIEEDPQ